MKNFFNNSRSPFRAPEQGVHAEKWISFLDVLKMLFLLALIVASFYSRAQNTSINVGGTTRSMIVYTPSNLGQNRPLLISLHGRDQDPTYQRNQAKWEEVADTAKFVVVYPQGINNSWDISGNRDIDFILAIIDHMKSQYNIDLNRVYVSGFSMGGMMSYHVANNIADKVAAIAPVSGYLFSNPVSSSRPMPIIHTHGTTDDVVLYSGVAAILEKWRGWNSCPSQGEVTQPYPVNTNSRSSRTYWAPCEEGIEMVLLTLDGKGHWHSNDPAAVHTTKEIWNFIRKYTLNPGPSVSFTSPLNNTGYPTGTAIELAVSASSPEGAVTDVKFYDGNTLLNTDNTSPYSFTWNNASLGSHTVKAVMTDNQGNTAEASITIRINVPQGPYNGLVHPIPGTIQLEEFDVGGNGFAYSDDSPGSETGVSFRSDEDVDIEECTDAGAGYNIGWASAGEWLEYTVNVETAGVYDMDLRVACNGDGRTVSFSMDGQPLSSDIAVPNTGGWQAWQTVKVSNINLLPGEKILRMTIGETDYINLNYVSFTLTKELKQEPFNSTAHQIPGRIEVEEYDQGGEGLAYHEANAEGNQGGATFRDDEVDIEETTDEGGGYNVGYILNGEWLEYTVNVSSTGVYNLQLRVAADGDGKLMHIEVDGEDVSGPVNIPNTGGWQTWETITVNGINLTEGEHVIRLAFDSDYMNLNYFQFNDVITGIAANAELAILPYPNPFSNTTFIETNNDLQYTIFSSIGEYVSGGTCSGKCTLGENLQPGIYFLTMEQESKTQTVKLVRK